MAFLSTCWNLDWHGINGLGYANVNKRNLYCSRMAGLIPYFKIGRAVQFRKSELDSAFERMRIG
jgi:hypothetical protein